MERKIPSETAEKNIDEDDEEEDEDRVRPAILVQMSLLSRRLNEF